ncbi:extracellular solute-binding protein [Paenibacillus sp. GYB004]|uniref:extracellular solute-binding protein n=1 Tax=Paenibacillus sp. GYB004 TaxID=2994393 RepID=UPI002F96CE92
MTRVRHRFRLLALSSLPLVFLSACSLTGRGEVEEPPLPPVPGKEEHVTVTVLYRSKPTFMNLYGSRFRQIYPNISIEVVESPRPQSGMDMKKETEALLAANPVDVVFADNFFDAWAKDGMLLNLDPLIRRDSFDIQNLYAGAIGHIRQRGGGALYALAPQFSTQALFYNQDLFDQYGVPYPKDKMNWEDVLRLAGRFPFKRDQDQLLYALYNPLSPSAWMQDIARTNGLSAIAEDGTKVVVNSPAWKGIFQTVIHAYREKQVIHPEPNADSSTFESVIRRNRFLMGMAAMTVDRYFLLANMTNAERQNINKSPNWQLVTAPTSPSAPNETETVSVHDMFAIHVQSKQIGAAWELVKFINGESTAKALGAGGGSSLLLTRVEHNPKEVNGRSVEAFHRLQPSMKDWTAVHKNTPIGFSGTFSGILHTEIEAVLGRGKSVEEGLAAIQEQSQLALDALK